MSAEPRRQPWPAVARDLGQEKLGQAGGQPIPIAATAPPADSDEELVELVLVVEHSGVPDRLGTLFQLGLATPATGALLRLGRTHSPIWTTEELESIEGSPESYG